MKTKLFLLIALAFSAFTSFAQTVHLTGSGVGGWNNPPLAQNLMATTDNTIYTLSNVQISGSGGSAEFKFMNNSDWGTTYGFTSASGWPSGVAGGGGGNIPGVAGFWNVTYNRSTGDYSFTPGVNPNATISIPSASGSQNMITTNGSNYSSPSTTLTAGTFTFSQAGSSNIWGGGSFPSGTATVGGTPITVPAGTYNINFNKANGDYTFVAVVVGMIGAGSPSGSWGSDSAMSSTNAVVYTINNAVVAGGGMKFRDDASWTFQYGTNGAANTNSFPTGTAIPNGTDMLTVSGTYNISFNRTTGEYNFANPLASNSFYKGSFNAYPNPTTDVWKFMSSADAITSVQIIDVLGKVVLTDNKSNIEISIDASTLTNGVYFAKISSANGSEILKLVKN